MGEALEEERRHQTKLQTAEELQHTDGSVVADMAALHPLCLLVYPVNKEENQLNDRHDHDNHSHDGGNSDFPVAGLTKLPEA